MKHDSCRKRSLMAVSLSAVLGLAAGPAMAGKCTNPDADEILKSMSDFLSSTKTFSVSADISNEVVTEEGQKLQLNSHSNLLFDRPSRFHVTRQGRFSDGALIYDGAKLTIHGKAANAYVQKEFAGTTDEAIRAIETSLGLNLPGADLLLSDPYSTLASNITSSGYYGKAYVGGVETHHLAFRTPTVDWQLWVKTGDQPLPMKYVITTKWTTGAPQYSVQLSDWNTAPVIADDRFTFVPPAGTKQLESLSVDESGELTIMQEGK
jgi:hypothetical protein